MKNNFESSMTPTKKQNSTHPTTQDEGIKINGYQQVLEMFKYADPAFRQSLLRRIEAKNPRLAQQIKSMLPR